MHLAALLILRREETIKNVGFCIVFGVHSSWRGLICVTTLVVPILDAALPKIVNSTDVVRATFHSAAFLVC